MTTSMLAPPTDNLTWLGLVIWDEARGEPDLGRAAVGQVVLNRAARKYASDGTLKDTILWRFQFSGFWFAMEHERYVRISKNTADAEAEAARLLAVAKADHAWRSCLDLAEALLGKAFAPHAPQWAALQANPSTVLYYNPVVCATPAWAAPSRQVCVIGRHTFFRA